MNHDKAREYFSAYYEGTLEAGLSETFERALRSDAQVQAEYRSFERLMEGLDVMKQPVPEPEIDLHEVISRRLDKHIYDHQRRVSFSIAGWWKSLALGGLATVALVATIVQLQSVNSNGAGNSMAGNIVAGGGDVYDKVELISADKGYALEYRSREPKILAISGPDGVELHKQVIEGWTVVPLDNPNELAKLLKVEIRGESEPVFIALPGTKMQRTASGEGSVHDLALALAGFYRIPVKIEGEGSEMVKWQLKPGDPMEVAEETLSSTNFSVHKGKEGLLSIHAN